MTPLEQPVIDLTIDDRLANQAVSVANQANAITGVYGISGTGKSNLADTAIEYTYETFGKISLVYAADLGGFGNKRLALIRRGIARVWDPRNHRHAYATMELMSLGAWPIELIDPERGYADPDVPLVLPRRVLSIVHCPSGHVVGRVEHAALLSTFSQTCPTCQTLTTLQNTSKIDKVVTRHRMFKDVGLRIYDSITALNEWGLMDLQQQSAAGTLPTTNSGGALLGAADALVSGEFKFGSSSEGQFGFVQNRTYGWLANIRKIPDHVVPPIATFHVEMSKEAKGNVGGGDLCYGPKIAGNAKTKDIPGWLGNCLHASKEPFDQTDPASPLVFRLWLTNHIDPRDPKRLPYMAKHRGTPLGMPPYLEDAPGAEPWSGFSLKVFFTKLQEQLVALEAEAAKRYPHAPGMWRGEDESDGEADEILGSVIAPSVGSGTPVSGGRVRRRIGAGVAVPAAPVVATVAPSPTVPAASGTGAGPAADVPPQGAPGSPSVPVATGEGLISPGGDVTTSIVPTPSSPQPSQANVGAVHTPTPTAGAVAGHPAPAAPVPSPTPNSVPMAPRIRRVARPPIG